MWPLLREELLILVLEDHSDFRCVYVVINKSSQVGLTGPPEGSGPEVRQVHEVMGMTWGTFLCIICKYGVVPGVRMLPTGTFLSLTSASSAI